MLRIFASSRYWCTQSIWTLVAWNATQNQLTGIKFPLNLRKFIEFFSQKKVASSLNFTSYLRTTMKNDTNNVGVELYAWGKLLQPLAIPSKMPFHSSLCATNLHVVTSQSPMLVQLLKVILWKSQATFVGRHNILHNHLYKVRCTCMFVCVKKHAILRNKLHIYIYTYIWLHIYLVDIRTLLSFYSRIHPLHSLFLFHVLCLSWLCHGTRFWRLENAVKPLDVLIWCKFCDFCEDTL